MGFWASAMSDENAKLGKYLKVPKKYLMNWIFLPLKKFVKSMYLTDS